MSYRDKCSISHRCHNLNRLPCSEYQFPIRPVFTPNDIWAFLALFWCPYHRDNLFTHLIATKRFGCMGEAAVHLCLGCLNWCSSAAVHVWQYQLQIYSVLSVGWLLCLPYFFPQLCKGMLDDFVKKISCFTNKGQDKHMWKGLCCWIQAFPRWKQTNSPISWEKMPTLTHQKTRGGSSSFQVVLRRIL